MLSVHTHSYPHIHTWRNTGPQPSNKVTHISGVVQPLLLRGRSRPHRLTLAGWSTASVAHRHPFTHNHSSPYIDGWLRNPLWSDRFGCVLSWRACKIHVQSTALQLRLSRISLIWHDNSFKRFLVVVKAVVVILHNLSISFTLSLLFYSFLLLSPESAYKEASFSSVLGPYVAAMMHVTTQKWDQNKGRLLNWT